MLRRIVRAGTVLLLVLATVLAANAWRARSRQIAVAPISPIPIDGAAAAERLAGALRLRTVASASDPALNADQFQAFHEYLRERFPNAHRVMQRETIAELSLLYTWPGRDPEAAPILLLAHEDVVPVAPGTEKDWSVEPFGSVVRDGYVWGRGALDDKENLLAQLEAVEELARRGFAPRRTILLAFGADEEVFGARGAASIAKVLEARRIRPAFVLDEGLMVTHGIMPGLDKPLALIGVAEKGFASLGLHVSAPPEHSAIAPVRRSAIGIISAALTRVAERPMPARVHQLARDTLASVAPEMSGMRRIVLSNPWLFEPVVLAQMSGRPGTEGAVRTTMAFTQVHAAGERENVVPGNADAVINCRLLPGDSISALQAHVARAIDDPRVEIRVLPGAREPSPVSRHDTPEYKLLETTIREVFPDAVVAPGLVIGGTDSVHYRNLSANIFRFMPLNASARDLERFHGTDERVSLDDYANAIRFYERLITHAAGAPAA